MWNRKRRTWEGRKSNALKFSLKIPRLATQPTKVVRKPHTRRKFTPHAGTGRIFFAKDLRKLTFEVEREVCVRFAGVVFNITLVLTGIFGNGAL